LLKVCKNFLVVAFWLGVGLASGCKRVVIERLCVLLGLWMTPPILKLFIKMEEISFSENFIRNTKIHRNCKSLRTHQKHEYRILSNFTRSVKNMILLVCFLSRSKFGKWLSMWVVTDYVFRCGWHLISSDIVWLVTRWK
jgi:hypothetical protein